MSEKPPINATVTITRLSHDGRGVADVNGKVTFLQGGLPGETVKFSYLRKHPSFDEGQVTEVLAASTERTEPRCQHFHVCGGCQLQHLRKETQLSHKQNVLLEFLQHQAHITPLEILAPIQSPLWGYRRKARLSIKFVTKKNKTLVGFREKKSRFVANIVHCEILPPHIGHLLPAFSELFHALTIREQIPQMEIAITEKENAIIIRHLSTFTLTDIEKLRTFSQIHRLKCYLQPAGPDSIHLIYPVDADPTLSYSIKADGIILHFLPQQFVQINDVVNQQMIAQALHLMELQPTDHVLDLFCGIGNFSLPIAKRVATVVGVEGDQQAVKQAIQNAALNHLTHAEFFCEDLSNTAYSAKWATQFFNKILLDPPRSGAKALMPWIVNHNPQRIVYISCNPATLARDTLYLTQQGYTLIKTGIIDMFPHTQHIEAIALFVNNHSLQHE